MFVHMLRFRTLYISWTRWKFKRDVIRYGCDYVVHFLTIHVVFIKLIVSSFDCQLMWLFLAIRCTGVQWSACLKAMWERNIPGSFRIGPSNMFVLPVLLSSSIYFHQFWFQMIFPFLSNYAFPFLTSLQVLNFFLFAWPKMSGKPLDALSNIKIGALIISSKFSKGMILKRIWCCPKPCITRKIWSTARFCLAEILCCRSWTWSKLVKWRKLPWQFTYMRRKKVESQIISGISPRQASSGNYWQWPKVGAARFRKPVSSYRNAFQVELHTEVVWDSIHIIFTVHISWSIEEQEIEGGPPVRELESHRLKCTAVDQSVEAAAWESR